MKGFKIFLIINLIFTLILYLLSYYHGIQPKGIFGGLDSDALKSFFLFAGAVILTVIEIISFIVYLLVKRRKIRYAMEEKQKEKIYEQWRREAAGEDKSK